MSGVYIKGMEMPKDGEHPYWAVIHSNGTVEYNENKGQGWQTSEAVPVPDHGRLVDADALAGLFRAKVAGEKGLGPLMVNLAALCIDNAPTIVPADKEVEK